MTITLPYRNESEADRPSATAGYPNGRIPLYLLSVADTVVTKQSLVEPAATAFIALAEEFEKIDGRQLCVTYGGMYRSYEDQERLFRDRYKPISTAAAAIRGFRNCKFWNGTWWLLDAGEAMAAVPGTSNHGLGLGVDLALRVAGKIVSLDEKALAILAKIGPKYGFWPTVRSELWHWVYLLGDILPPAIRVEVPSAPLIRGMKGSDVRALQRIMHELKFRTAKPNGNFGRGTEREVAAMQKALKVRQTRRYDADTRRALKSLLEFLAAL